MLGLVTVEKNDNTMDQAMTSNAVQVCFNFKSFSDHPLFAIPEIV